MNRIIGTLMNLKLKGWRFTMLNTIKSIGILLMVILSVGCKSEGDNTAKREASSGDPPFFSEINWPAPYTELENRELVITGELECPEGYFETMPMNVNIFPVELLNPAVEPIVPPSTQEDLQELLEENDTVRDLVNKAKAELLLRVTQGPGLPLNLTKGLHVYPLPSDKFNQYNFVNFSTGEFRIDFDEWATLTNGEKLFIVIGIDALGQTAILMNIYSTAPVISDYEDDLDDTAVAWATELQDMFGDLMDVLSVSGDDRGDDIALLIPFVDFIDDAYGTSYNPKTWDTAAANLRTAVTNVSNIITDSTLKAFYELAGDFVAGRYEHKSFMYWSKHYMVTEAQQIDLESENDDAILADIAKFEQYDPQFSVTDRGNGVKEFTLTLYEGQNVVAQFTVVGDPFDDLEVTGFIGSHTIQSADYNPYFFELYGVFDSEGILFPKIGI